MCLTVTLLPNTPAVFTKVFSTLASNTVCVRLRLWLMPSIYPFISGICNTYWYFQRACFGPWSHCMSFYFVKLCCCPPGAKTFLALTNSCFFSWWLLILWDSGRNVYRRGNVFKFYSFYDQSHCWLPSSLWLMLPRILTASDKIKCTVRDSYISQ